MDPFNGARVYFSPCGLGLGHVGRCHTVGEELRRRGADLLFSTYLEGVDYAGRHGLPVVASPPLSLATVNGRVDLKASSVTQGLPALPRFIHQVKVEIEYMKGFRPDVVVSDSRLSSIFAANLLDVPTALITNQFTPIVPRSRRNFRLSKVADGVLLTLIGRGWAASDIILVPDFPEPYTISLESLRVPRPYRRLVRHVGPLLPTRPEEVRSRESMRRKLGVEGGQMLIYAAISGPLQERLPLISLLAPAFEKFPDRYRVVMSTGTPNGGSSPSSRGALTVIPWVPSRFEYLQACDLVVSRAGHETVMQSICFGKPQILVPTSGHTEQYANARRAKELGLAEVMHQKDVTPERLLALADRLTGDDGYLKNLSKIGSLELDGLSNAVDAIGSLLGG